MINWKITQGNFQKPIEKKRRLPLFFLILFSPFVKILQYLKFWACGSVVERVSDKDEAVGPIPTTPTKGPVVQW